MPYEKETDIIRKNKGVLYSENLYTENLYAGNEEIMNNKKEQGACEMCMYYEYDEDYECYTCQMNLDEDEMARFIMNQTSGCPYFRFGDEYMIVRKQM